METFNFNKIVNSFVGIGTLAGLAVTANTFTQRSEAQITIIKQEVGMATVGLFETPDGVCFPGAKHSYVLTTGNKDKTVLLFPQERIGVRFGSLYPKNKTGKDVFVQDTDIAYSCSTNNSAVFLRSQLRKLPSYKEFKQKVMSDPNYRILRLETQISPVLLVTTEDKRKYLITSSSKAIPKHIGRIEASTFGQHSNQINKIPVCILPITLGELAKKTKDRGVVGYPNNFVGLAKFSNLLQSKFQKNNFIFPQVVNGVSGSPLISEKKSISGALSSSIESPIDQAKAFASLSKIRSLKIPLAKCKSSGFNPLNSQVITAGIAFSDSIIESKPNHSTRKIQRETQDNHESKQFYPVAYVKKAKP